MFPHWEYVLHELFGRVKSVQALTATHIPQRWDEQDKPYDATADDAAYGIFELDGGAIAQINSSWAVRVNRDELVEFQVDGTEGSAVAGLRNCRVQHRSATPKPVWNPDIPATYSFRDQWQEVPDNAEFDNGFKAQWELFFRHVYADAPYHWDLLAGCPRRPARRTGPEVLGRGRPSRRTGDLAVTIRLPGADGLLKPYTPAPNRSPSPPAPPSPPVRSSRRRTSSPTRTRTCPRIPRPPSTGTPPSPSAATSGRTAWVSPRRWTPRSAAWASTGRARRN